MVLHNYLITHFFSGITVKPRQCILVRAQDLILGTLQVYFEVLFCYGDISKIIILSQINSELIWSIVLFQNVVVISRCALYCIKKNLR